jgi:ribosomal protein S18 acetylase RimI-like enzyme
MSEPQSSRTALEFRALAPALSDGLGDFFEALAGSEAAAHFHPHPLTRESAEQLCQYEGRDLYFAAVCDSRVLGYGLLRGWDEGCATPSLGIALAAQARGTGLARAFMLFLHAAARLRGAERIRLTVFRSNVRAVALYRSLGYRFEPKNEDEDVGLLEIAPSGS